MQSAAAAAIIRKKKKGKWQMLEPGIRGHAALRVTTENTARALGSGELEVLATQIGRAHV